MKLRLIGIAITLLVAAMTLSDTLNAISMRYLSHGDALTGTRLLALAERLNPYSFNVKSSQIESLFAFYRGDSDTTHLDEAVNIAQSLVKQFPGNAQARGILATTKTMQLTHQTHFRDIIAGEYILDKAISMDPISTGLIEDFMFILAANRYDYARYRQLGLLRLQLTDHKLRMLCPLDQKPWLSHR